MATVTRKFKEDFDTWANDRISCGQLTQQEMDDLKALDSTEVEFDQISAALEECSR